MDSTSIVAMSDFIRAEEGAHDLIETVSYFDDSEPNWNERPYFTAVERHRGKVGTHIPTLFSERTLDLPDGGYLLPGADANTVAIEERLERSIGPGRYRAVVSGVGGDELLGGPINPLPELTRLSRARENRPISRTGYSMVYGRKSTRGSPSSGGVSFCNKAVFAFQKEHRRFSSFLVHLSCV